MIPFKSLNNMVSVLGLENYLYKLSDDNQNAICDCCDFREHLIDTNKLTIYDFDTGLSPKCSMVNICNEFQEFDCPSREYRVFRKISEIPNDIDDYIKIIETDLGIEDEEEEN